MDRAEIISTFRAENPEITARVLTDTVLGVWCKQGDKRICAMTRCIVDRDGMTISTTENDTNWSLSAEIPKFYDIDEFPGGGVAYDDLRIDYKTIGELDIEDRTWRSRTSGAPKAYYRRGDYIYMDRAIDSNAEDLKVYAVLIPDDFDSDDKTPYNELSYLEPFHYGLVEYLQMRAKQKIGKEGEGDKAEAQFLKYVAWMKKTIGGGKYGKMFLTPRDTDRNCSRY